ncbi:DUF6156 family protein [Hyphomicrobium sp. MC1]|uniref:DUF6156 family protein n=1 Tax=Hyphomicrobium sp. (strain MC1) TaxID=717785 RepID=UPI00059E884E|nr:DUF6156 family protein [Hyphomicrobium sp. MC1]
MERENVVGAAQQDCRYFVSYSGVKLPFQLINPVAEEALSNRNTYFKAYFDEAGRLKGFDKMVYGEVKLSHRYDFHGNGALKVAEIVMLDEEPMTLYFDEVGAQIPSA